MGFFLNFAQQHPKQTADYSDKPQRPNGQKEERVNNLTPEQKKQRESEWDAKYKNDKPYPGARFAWELGWAHRQPEVAALTQERDRLRQDYETERDQFSACSEALGTVTAERDTALAKVSDLHGRLAKQKLRANELEAKVAELEASIDAIECKKLRTKDGVLIQGGMNLWVCMDGIFKSGPCRVQLEDGEYGAFIGNSLYSAEWCYSTRAAALAAQSANGQDGGGK